MNPVRQKTASEIEQQERRNLKFEAQHLIYCAGLALKSALVRDHIAKLRQTADNVLADTLEECLIDSEWLDWASTVTQAQESTQEQRGPA